jgi:hypothetical protein
MKNLIDSDTYTFEILRLTPHNEVVGQPPSPARSVHARSD